MLQLLVVMNRKSKEQYANTEVYVKCISILRTVFSLFIIGGKRYSSGRSSFSVFVHLANAAAVFHLATTRGSKY